MVFAAHDGAYFDARILRRDISEGSIIITTEDSSSKIDIVFNSESKDEVEEGTTRACSSSWSGGIE